MFTYFTSFNHTFSLNINSYPSSRTRSSPSTRRKTSAASRRLSSPPLGRPSSPRPALGRGRGAAAREGSQPKGCCTEILPHHATPEPWPEAAPVPAGSLADRPLVAPLPAPVEEQREGGRPLRRPQLAGGHPLVEHLHDHGVPGVAANAIASPQLALVGPLHGPDGARAMPAKP